MKRFLAILSVFLLTCNLQASRAYRDSSLAPRFAALNTLSQAATASILLDAPTHQIAYKFWLGTAGLKIHAADVNLAVNGSTTGITIIAEIQSDSGDVPSGSILGSATSAFAAPSSSGWTGLKTLGADTGTLSINTPYWLVLTDGGGTAPSGTNNTQARNASQTVFGGKARQYNGTNWTTTTASSLDGIFVIQFSDGTFYSGAPISATAATSTYTGAYGANRLGFSTAVGSQVTVAGITLRIIKTGSPSDLDIELYSGATLLTTETVAAASIVSAATMPFFFSSPKTLSGGVTLYVMLHQHAGGGDSSNYYSFTAQMLNAAYISAVANASQRLISGSGTNPTTMTAETDQIPVGFTILMDDPASSLSCAACPPTTGGNTGEAH